MLIYQYLAKCFCLQQASHLLSKFAVLFILEGQHRLEQKNQPVDQFLFVVIDS